MKTTALVILITAIGGPCLGSVSTNVPLNHWSYAAIDKLIGACLIDSAMPGTRPFSRLEMARLIYEAGEKATLQGEKNRIILALLDRLQQEFRCDLDLAGPSRMGRSEDYIKPIEDPYLRLVYGKESFDLENQSGDRFGKGGNTRLGLAARMNVFDTLAFYVHPEYRNSSDADSGFEAIEAYGKMAIGRFEVEVGKDSLWWGPGYHASMMMSNNAENFTMLKVSNPEPILLPWIFRGLGPLKAVYFLTQLEENRDHPNAKLAGLRMSIKPHPNIELGASRTMMFGGEGVPDVGLKNYLAVLGITHEQANNNQLAGFDVSIFVPCADLLPIRSARLYMDMAGEDEAGYLPSKWGRLYGIQLSDLFKTGRTDLRIEYANDHVDGYANVFYAHSSYTSGYTYKGRIIGHHMGTDSEDLLIRLTHYLTEELVVGGQYDLQTANLSSSPQPVTHQFGADLMWFAPHNWEVRAAYRFEETSSDDVSLGSNHIFDLGLVYNF